MISARSFLPVLGGMLLLPVLVGRACGEVNELDALPERLKLLTQQIERNSTNVDLYSQRGDALFFLGRFAEAARDYSRMVEVDASLDASHWRRGIALFYAGEYAQAAAQFERYHSFDKVDRENGIWRYLCQVKAQGVEVAREGLLKYEKDDREPFPAVYRLFAGEVEPEQIVATIEAANIDEGERTKRLFYAHLYIGLWHAVHDRPDAARHHLKASVDNNWPRTAGYGPNYMWHVGRLHYDRLAPEAVRKLD